MRLSLTMRIQIDPVGYIEFAGHKVRCALGRGGLSSTKHEGDGATPIGEFRLGRVFYRADRIAGPPETGLATFQITQDMGWCDDVDHRDYNTLIRLPHPARHENLWRGENVYDVVIEILYNTDPVRAGRGSAIFIHVAKPDYSPTEGCIALTYCDILFLLRNCNDGDTVAIPHPKTP